MIAKELGLLPERIRSWDEWSDLSVELQMRIHHYYTYSVNDSLRYYYGELRLRRLNHIYLFLTEFTTYHNIYRQNDHVLSENFGRLLLFLVCLSTILSALQVVISTQHTPEKLVGFSYWFGLVSVAMILFFVVVQLLLFVMTFVWHFVAMFENLEKKALDWKLAPMRLKSVIMGRNVRPGRV